MDVGMKDKGTQKQICGYHDVAEHLNISSNKDLFSYTIPKRNWEESLEVHLDFTLVSILQVSWKNDFVSWDPLDFCNITNITLPVKLFWTPDIYIEERADEDKFTRSPMAFVTSDGYIHMLQTCRLTSSCSLDVHAFPFDEQKCNLTMTTIYSAKELLMKSSKSSMKANQDSHKSYLSGGEWKFEELRVIENMMPYETTNISTVTYEVSMKRQSILYVLVLILPTFTLFLLDMAISYALASPGEKIAFKVTLILQVSLLSLILNDMLPATSDDPPVIAMFFTGMFVFMVFGILENAFVLYLKQKKPESPPFMRNKFMNIILRKKKKQSEKPVADLGDGLPKGSQQAGRLSLPEKCHAEESLVFLKHINAELQQIRKHLSLEECQDDSESVVWDNTILLVEEGLYFTRLIFSIIFLTFVAVQWTF
nr:5-hydroxytryptamine receptor 3A-like [Zootoca vivipara]